MASENVDKLLLALRENEWLMLEFSTVIAKIVDEAQVKLTSDEFAEFFGELAKFDQQEGLTLKLAKY